MKRLILPTMMFLAAAFVQGCSHKQTAETLDKKMAQEEAPTGSTALSLEASDLILSSADLTEKQMTELLELKTETRRKMREANVTSLKLRSILYKDLAAKNFNRREVDLIKKKIKNVEKLRVSTLLDAVEKANSILGRNATADETRLNEFYFDLYREQEGLQ